MNISLSRFDYSMKLTKVLTVVGILTTSASIVCATDDLPKAETLLDRHIEATGGKEAYLSIKTRKRTGTFSSDIAGHSLQANIIEQTQAPDMSHLSFDGDRLVMVRVCNGKEAWEWNAGQGSGAGGSDADTENTRLLSGPEKAQAIEKAHFYADVEWRDGFKEVRTIEIVDIDGRPAYEVQVTTNDGEQYSQYFDKNNGRRVKVTRTIESSQVGKIDTEVFQQDYKEFDGVWLPTKIVQVIEMPGFGSGTQTWTFASVQHNVDFPESLFKRPAAISGDDGK